MTGKSKCIHSLDSIPLACLIACHTINSLQLDEWCMADYDYVLVKSKFYSNIESCDQERNNGGWILA